MNANVGERRVPTLTMKGVTHRYGRTRALTDVSLSVSGGLVGLLGPNGAGKSTMLSIASTLIRPGSGEVRVLGHDVTSVGGRRSARKVLGVLPQRFALVPSMRVQETVAYAAWVHGVSSADCVVRAEEALDTLHLSQLAGSKVRTLSGGQRQRLGIAAAIAHDPQLLVLDEPTVGLDPVARVEFRRHLRSIAHDRTVIISTHLVEDVAHLCDRVIILNHGRVSFEGDVSVLLSQPDASSASSLSSPLEAAYENLLRDSARE